jgi:sugar diacid utilization regulator
LLNEVRGDPPGLVELAAGGWYGVATPVATPADQAGRWLVLASKRRDFMARLAKPAAEATAPLLSALARLDDVVREQEQAVKAALLEEALEPAEARDVLPLAARAAAFGVDFSTPVRLVVVRRAPVRTSGRAAAGLGGICRTLVAGLEHAHVPHLAHARNDEIVALVQSREEPASRTLAAILESLEDVVAGVGRTIATITEAHHSLRDAEIAADRAASDHGRRVLCFEDFDVGTFVVSEIPPERLRPKVDEILSVLRANPALHEALGAYFAHDLDIAATAASLHMHRNSLRYRLARAEHMLGRSLKQPSAIAAVYIALVAEAAERGVPGPPSKAWR